MVAQVKSLQTFAQDNNFQEALSSVTGEQVEEMIAQLTPYINDLKPIIVPLLKQFQEVPVDNTIETLEPILKPFMEDLGKQFKTMNINVEELTKGLGEIVGDIDGVKKTISGIKGSITVINKKLNESEEVVTKVEKKKS
jgi:hypothetical protein